MLYASKDKIMEWQREERRKREVEIWRGEQKERWRGVVVVGILKDGVRCGKGGKRVKFKDGMEGEGKDKDKVEFEAALGG